jgi:hypothetical protein
MATTARATSPVPVCSPSDGRVEVVSLGVCLEEPVHSLSTFPLASPTTIPEEPYKPALLRRNDPVPTHGTATRIATALLAGDGSSLRGGSAAPWRRGRLGGPDLIFTFVAQKTTDFRVTDSAAVLLSLYQETPSYFLMVDRLRRTQCLHLPHAPPENNHHDEPHHSARSFSAE